MKTEPKTVGLLDKEQRATIEELKEARSAATEIFKTPTPSVMQVMGVYDRAFTFDEPDDVELSVRELILCVTLASDVFNETSPNAEQIFAIYDAVFESEE